MRLQVKGKNVEVTPVAPRRTPRRSSRSSRSSSPSRRRSSSSCRRRRTRRSPRATSPRRRSSRKGPTLRAREASRDIRASIDQLVDNLERQVKRYREKRTRRAAAARARTTARVSLFPPARAAHCGSRARAALPLGDERRPRGRRGTSRGSTALHRAREWDAVVTVDGAGARRRPRAFVALPAGELVVEEGPGRRRAARGARRARARAARTAPRRSAASDGLWAVAAQRGSRSSSCRESPGDEIELDRRTATSGRCSIDGERVVRLDRRARAPRACRPRPPDRRRALGGRGRRRCEHARPRRGRSAGPSGTLCSMAVDSTDSREVPSLRRGQAHEAAAASRPRTSRRSSPSSGRSPTPSCARRRPSSASGSRTARSSTTCSSRPTPPSARRGSASPTSACSTCR